MLSGGSAVSSDGSADGSAASSSEGGRPAHRQRAFHALGDQFLLAGGWSMWQSVDCFSWALGFASLLGDFVIHYPNSPTFFISSKLTSLVNGYRWVFPGRCL